MKGNKTKPNSELNISKYKETKLYGNQQKTKQNAVQMIKRATYKVRKSTKRINYSRGITLFPEKYQIIGCNRWANTETFI